MLNIATMAQEAAESFYERTLDDKKTTMISDDAPKWVRDMLFMVLPDHDTTGRATIVEGLEMLSTDWGHGCKTDLIDVFATDTTPYYHDLTDWLANTSGAVEACNDALNDEDNFFPGSHPGIFDIITAGQATYRRNIIGSIITFLECRADSEGKANQ